jgi:hypothetical protein
MGAQNQPRQPTSAYTGTYLNRFTSDASRHPHRLPPLQRVSMSLEDVSATLLRFPQLKSLNFHGLNQFMPMACLARETITFQQINSRRPPPVLPLAILKTISMSLNVADPSLIQTCWAAFKDILWDHPVVSPTDDEITSYNKAALGNGTCGSLPCS